MYYREESFNNRQNTSYPIVQYILPKRLQPLAEDREKGKSYVEVRGNFFSPNVALLWYHLTWLLEGIVSLCKLEFKGIVSRAEYSSKVRQIKTGFLNER